MNQCFYLSLSAAVTALPEGIAHTALRLKRTLEAAVRLVRGEEGVQDDQLGAFADFLEDGMTSHPTLCRRTIAVFDGAQGSVRLIRSPTHWCRDSPVIALLYLHTGALPLGQMVFARPTYRSSYCSSCGPPGRPSRCG